MKRELKVSFALPAEDDEKNHSLNRTASQQYNLSFTGPRHNPGISIQHLVTPRSPLYPENIIPHQHRIKAAAATDTVASHEPAPESNHDPVEPLEASAKRDEAAAPEVDLANGAILIYPKKIDNLRRFRILFVGILLFISSSTQGMHSLFGTLYLQVLFRYDFRKMTIVYLCGQAFGMFVFPFGMLYDWFGPRVVVASATVIAAVGHLLFALTFGGHIEATVSNCAIFYSIMCWGCYALDVTVLPAVLSHMPRDRGQPTGLLETFSGLGSSLFSCLFRGFFANNFEHLMWFLFAFTLFAGVIGTWYLEDAPYVVNRWEQRRITPREQLRRYLIRNRYMSQLVPQRRYMLMTLILIILNFYLTIQAVVVAYLASEMTDGKRRGIAIGAIVIVLLVLILVVPLDAFDGPTEQDKQVIEAAKEKEERLKAMHAERVTNAADANRATDVTVESGAGTTASQMQPSADTKEEKQTEAQKSQQETVDGQRDTAAEDEMPHAHNPLSISDESLSSSDTVHTYTPLPKVPPLAPPRRPSQQQQQQRKPSAPTSAVRQHRGGLLTQHMGLPLYKPAAPERSLISVDIDDEDDTTNTAATTSNRRSSANARSAQPTRRSESHRNSHQSANTPAAAAAASASASASVSVTPQQTPPRSPQQHLHLAPERANDESVSYLARVDNRGNLSLEVTHASAAPPSSTPATPNRPPAAVAVAVTREYAASPTAHISYSHPRVEVITLCGEVFVAPVHQTTFWESLTYMDIWLIFYVTLCVWGVGLTMTGNWNIYIMLLARYGGMQQKHYILFAAMAGVSTAGGRVFLGMYERLLSIIRERTGVAVVPTVIYPIASIGLFLGTVFWIALPGDKVLVLAYLIGPAFYGISSSITPYVLGTIFDRDLGMHYGFCFFAGAIGFVLCFWCSWYLTYKEQVALTPLGYLCIGQRRCMNRAVGIYMALVFSSIFPAYILHRRYSKLVRGELVQKRVVVPHLRRIFRCCGCGGDSEILEEDQKASDGDKQGGDGNALPSSSPAANNANPLSAA